MRKIIAGNWKMNGKLENLLEIKKISNEFARSKIEIIICPPFTLLSAASEIAKNVYLGAQNLHPESEGAFTGEISADMLVDLGVKYSIIGHSERRNEHNETNEIVARKVKISLEKKLQTIICIGETELQRKENSTLEILEQQLLESLANNTSSEKLIVAYEPIWSIGSGLIPKKKELFETIKFIKKKAKNYKVLYGGSVNPKNINSLNLINNIDGYMIGGASQDPKKFIDIIKKTYN